MGDGNCESSFYRHPNPRPLPSRLLIQPPLSLYASKWLHRGAIEAIEQGGIFALYIQLEKFRILAKRAGYFR